MTETNNAFILFEEGRSRNSGDYADVLSVFDNMAEAKQRLKKTYKDEIKSFNKKFGDDYEIEYNDDDTRFCLNHNEYDDYVEVKIVERKVLNKS